MNGGHAHHGSRCFGVKPISRRSHGVIDYILALFEFVAPTLFKLEGPTGWLVRGFGAAQLGLNAITDHPAAVKPVVAFAIHARIEKWSGPSVLALALFFGGWRHRRNRTFLIAYGIFGATIFNLTNWRDCSSARLPV